MSLLDTDWVIQALANRQPVLGMLERLATAALHHDLTLLTFNLPTPL